MGKRVVVDELGRVKLSDLRTLINFGKEKGKPVGWSFTLMSIDYKVYFIPEEMRLIFNWKLRGKEYVEKVKLITAPSNLGLNPVLYFECPYSKKKCRKLLTDGTKLFCMKALSDGFTYKDRNRSKHFRMMKYLLKEPPQTKNRKLYYNGELTPFGKSLAKYYKKNFEAENNGKYILATMDRRRGRPRKKKGYTPPTFDN
jgi:hypothetical protein